ncbi:hypothetical protein M8J75_002925 [Diaphorina citri]|nr:hypothetical protein M8J75_002925 [Diaphorina citri]
MRSNSLIVHIEVPIYQNPFQHIYGTSNPGDFNDPSQRRTTGRMNSVYCLPYKSKHDYEKRQKPPDNVEYEVNPARGVFYENENENDRHRNDNNER